MLFKKLIPAMIVSLLLVNKGQAQTLKSISILEKQNQDCLDKGEDMTGCAADFGNQMDSLLNLAYNNLRKTLSPAGKDSLKAEELSWIKKRDAAFKKNAKMENDDLGGGTMSIMATYQDNADFVKERAIVLIKRLNAVSK